MGFLLVGKADGFVLGILVATALGEIVGAVDGNFVVLIVESFMGLSDGAPVVERVG